MPETFTQVCAFCGLAVHYRHFIKVFTHLEKPLYDVLGKEVKMGPVQLPPEMWEAVKVLKQTIQTTPVLVFPDFKKAISPRNGCIEGGPGSGTLPETGGQMIPSCGFQ